jgi:GntR family transcriptional regulator
VVFLRRLRLADGHPIAVQNTRLPHHLCAGLLSFDFSSRSLFDILTREFNLHLAHSDTLIEAALAGEEEANLLALDPPSAVLISEQTTYLDNGMVIEITRSIFNAGRYKLYSHV